MNNYDKLRSSVGNPTSKYFLDTSIDYLTKHRSNNEYGRSADYGNGTKQYDSGQYSSGYDSYNPDKPRHDYTYNYDNYASDNSNYSKTAQKKLDLRNTTSVLPSYFMEQRKNNFDSHSPRH